MSQQYEYEYDDMGVWCRYCEDDGWEPLEPHCLNCGATECECDEYCEGMWFNEETSEWVGGNNEADK